jgi:hypothetical protein
MVPSAASFGNQDVLTLETSSDPTTAAKTLHILDRSLDPYYFQITPDLVVDFLDQHQPLLLPYE